MQIPGYLAAQDALKAQGIDEIVYCVNDGAVMTVWHQAGMRASFQSLKTEKSG